MTVTKGRGRGSRNNNASNVGSSANVKVSRSNNWSYIDMGSVAELYANLQAEFALSGGEVSSSLQSVPGANEQTRIQADIGTLLTHIENRLATCNEELAKVKRIGDIVEEERLRRKKKIKRENGEAVDVEDDISTSAGVETTTDSREKSNEPDRRDDSSSSISKVKREDDESGATVKRSGKSAKSTADDAMGVDEDDDHADSNRKKDEDSDKTNGGISRSDIKRAESVDSEPDLPLADEVMARSRAAGSSDGSSSDERTHTKNEPETPPLKLAPVSKNYYDPGTPRHSATDFAEIQASSIAALKLFDESITVDSEGNPVNDVEVLRKKYGVASFPESNLKDLLPGEIPDEDFTRAKPANQVQFSTFATFIEPFFRPLTEEDISFLKHKSVGLDGTYTRSIASPYLIPPLGPLYSDTWADEDGQIANTYSLSPPPSGSFEKALFKGSGSSEAINEDTLDAPFPKVSLGPLASRLLSALLREPGEYDTEVKEEDEPKIKSEDDTVTNNSTTTSSPSALVSAPASANTTLTTIATSTATSLNATPSKPASSLIEPAKYTNVKADYVDLDDRLKREFRYVGILDVNLLRKEDKNKKRLNGTSETNGSAGNAANGSSTTVAAIADDDEASFEMYWANGTEDDEICYEIRKLQKKFRQVTKINQACKRILLPIVQEQMAYQEYTQILEDLDKQVDQAYAKRMRNMPKGKKKKGFAANLSNSAGGSTPNSSGPEKPPSYKPLLEKRLRWIEKIGSYFKPPEIMKRTPTESIFANIQIDDDDDDADAGDDDDDMYSMTL
ncbi:histone acetyltransferase NGG1 [Sugiyamaella lignohabitans]|uniref:Histone acetyltransferase NGG1 n=1 Tax=Sugiyamaella lignohabitans TaxID=796027 RepID=A0A167DMD9_9ASCO|nr:histone acetyltransferase NGG1 [Sugiyamaella lignohabitans]ANB13069.1 histone acetyltransferase NGG1 [Sugiyamaella lignohabitans]